MPQAGRDGDWKMMIVLARALKNGKMTRSVKISKVPHIVLIGPMGSGKSRVGRLLARRTRLPFVDTDQLIEEICGMKIPQFFTEFGETEFRRVEHLAVLDACKGPAGIIATGGGVVETPSNLRELRSKGVVFYLDVPVRILAERLRGDTKRPLLKGKNHEEVLRQILMRRSPLYRKAHYSIRSGVLSPYETVSRILDLYDRCIKG